MRESRNSCSVEVGGVGVEGMITSGKIGVIGLFCKRALEKRQYSENWWCGHRRHDVVQKSWNTCVRLKEKDSMDCFKKKKSGATTGFEGANAL